MKRSWFGLGLLLLLLVLSAMTSARMGSIHRPIEAELKRAAELALAEDWEGAEAFLEKAGETWEQTGAFRAYLADHTPLEEVDAGFALLRTYCRSRERVSFAACCADLAEQTAAIGEAHALSWKNLL